ncbi:T9SS type A sorting domain-containing protein [candidate division GN15 bacterium]|nr:T9SS type A sorting domain-containing protein [candidate division GN15 bacterium]
MFYHANSRTILGACLFAALLMAGSVSAETMAVEPSGALHFQLGDGEAWVDSSRTYALNHHATIPFSVKWDTTGPGNIGMVQAKIAYDAELLEVKEATVNGNWTGDFDYTVTTVGDTLGYLLLEFTAGSLAPPSSFTELAGIVFKAKCQEELNVNDIEFVDDSEVSFIMADYNKFYPDAGNWDDGTVTIADYHASVELPDLEFTGSIGDTTRSVEITGSCNFSTYALVLFVQYDGDMLDYAGFTGNPGLWQQTFDVYLSDGLVKLILLKYGSAERPGAPEFEDELVATLDFELECDINGDNSDLSFLVDSCYWVPSRGLTCQELQDFGADYSDVGSISSIDSAGLAGYFDEDPVSFYDPGTFVDLILTGYNSFVTGAKDAVDTRIVFNLDLGTNFDYESDNGTLSFDDLTTQQARFLSLRQSTPASPAVYGIVEDYTDRHTVVVEWDTTGLSPSWTNRYAPAPEYVETFTGAYGTTGLPDTVGCFTATAANSMLDLDDIEPLEIAVGQFYGESPSTSACPKQDIYVRPNFNLDSFYVRVDVKSACDVTAIDLATGVTATQIDDSTLSLSSNGSWSAPTEYELTWICELEYGCSGIGSVDAGLVISDERMYVVAPSDSEFVDVSVGGVTVNNWMICPDPDFPDRRNDLTPGEAVEEEEHAGGTPTDYALYQNYPNPFNPVTSISFDLPRAGAWRLTVYNIAGQVIDEFAGNASAGTVEVQWDASDHASGVYLYRLETGEFGMTKKMLLIK